MAVVTWTDDAVAAAVDVPVIGIQAALVPITAGAVGVVATVVPLTSAVATALEGGQVMGSGSGVASPRCRSPSDRVSHHAAAGSADR